MYPEEQAFLNAPLSGRHGNERFLDIFPTEYYRTLALPLSKGSLALLFSVGCVWGEGHSTRH